MKKTIAILLILVIGMVGVFAEADKTLRLGTKVLQLTGFKVTETAIGSGDEHDFSKFTDLDERVFVGVNTEGTMTNKAYLTVANNSTTPFSIGVKGVELTATNISTTIGYTYTIGTASEGIYEFSGASFASDEVGDEDYLEALTVSGDAVDGMLIVSKEIIVTVNANDFNSAAPGDYTAYLYFNIATE